MPIAAAFLKGLLDYVGLLFDPRVLVLLAIAGSLGFMKGCEHRGAEADRQDREREHAAELQAQHTIAVNRRNREVRDEIEEQSGIENARLSDELDAAIERLRLQSRPRIVPRPSGGPAEPVRQSPQPVADGTAAGGISVSCFDADRLDAGIRAAYDRAVDGLRALIGRGISGLDDSRWWGAWGRQVGACPIPPPVDTPADEPIHHDGGTLPP